MEHLIINIQSTCCAYDKSFQLNLSNSARVGKLPLNPVWMKLPAAEWTVRTTPPYLWLYLRRGERQSGLQKAINHGTFPATQASTLASYTGEMKGRESDWVTRGETKKIKEQIQSCDLIKLLCLCSQGAFTYIYFTVQKRCLKKKTLQGWTVMTKTTAFPCHQHGNAPAPEPSFCCPASIILTSFLFYFLLC